MDGHKLVHGYPRRLSNNGMVCEAELIDLDGDGTDEVIVVTGGDSVVWWGTVMKLGGDGHWAPVATLPSPHCAGDLEALRAGTYKLVPQPAPVWRAIQIGPRAIAPTPPPASPETCPSR